MRTPNLTALACFCLLAGLAPCAKPAETPEFRTVRISNTEPRRDVNGEIVDAHDGCLLFLDGRYYLYGTAYGKSAGFGINNRFRVYSSPDLERWSFEGELLQAPPDGVYYRPYVAYNPKTRKYVLWYNWYPKLWDGQVGVAVSDTPVGPFTIANPNVRLSQAAHRPGDGSLFVDDDGAGYFIYTVIGQNHAVRIERLTPDFLGSSAEVSEVLGAGSEAPAMFRHSGRYYVLFDKTCCFCPGGSGARVFVASKPLGPYTERPNINRGEDGRPRVPAQQTFVATIPAAGGPAFIWMGDRWSSRTDGLKGHDFQFWSSPLRFTPDGGIAPIEDSSEWRLSVRVGTPQTARRQPYIWPKKKDPNPLKADPCTGQPLAAEAQ